MIIGSCTFSMSLKLLLGNHELKKIGENDYYDCSEVHEHYEGRKLTTGNTINSPFSHDINKIQTK